MAWLKQALTGPDNQTVAIGRLMAFAVTVILLICLPVAAAGTVIAGSTRVDDWRQLFEALGIYVPLIVAALTGLIRVTNPTEPRVPGDNDGGPNA